MKKSIFAIFFMLFALFTTPVVYAEDEATATADEPLPPLVDEAIANDTSQ